MKALPALFALFAAAWIAPSALAQSPNTHVRFHFYRGATVIGNVEVELFDSDKPVTVSNFLSYVRGGYFKNTWIHRCIPGFVVQAGGYWSAVPTSTASYRPAFQGLTPSFGTITNEFDVGPRLSNTFGTIAMARLPGQTNSATSQWFFNLGDNSSRLDALDGGFTVFGKVVGATNALDFFNHPSAQLRFLDVIPTSVDTRLPHQNELYHVDVSVLPLPADKPPLVTITSPAQNATVSNDTITVTGTASDDQAVTAILYSSRNRPLTNAPAAASWSIQVEVAPGTNLITVFSLDNSGQRSVAATRTIFHSVPEPFHLAIQGNGTVVGATDGQLFEYERAVNLTAKPEPGHLFAGWSGSIVFPLAKDRVLMDRNFSVTATFVPNPFPELKGTYSGLFFNPGAPFQPNGTITFSVTDVGKVSGKLNVVGRSVPFSGGVSAYGDGEIQVPAASVAPLFNVAPDWSVRFHMDTTNKTDQIFGPSTDNPGYPHVRNPDPQYGFTSEMRVNRVRPGTTAAPSPFAGKYTISIPGSANPALLTEGELVNVSNLVATLSAHTNLVSQYLWDRFSPDVVSVLTNAQSTTSEQQSNLVVAFNQIIGGASIDEPSRFADVPLSAETREWRGRNPTGADLIRLNRLLLQDAYPLSIVRVRPLHPEGDSYGAVTVAASGVAKFTGTLADGTAFTQSAQVGTNGAWPLYSGLYGGRGWMFGWVQFDFHRPDDDLHGEMHWLRSGPFPGKVYPNGFQTFPFLDGSRYTTATSTNRVLNFTNGVVSLTGPNLAAPPTNDVFLATNNAVLNLDTNKLILTIVKPSGLFSGTVTPAGETRSIPFKGALLPKQNHGAGYYISTNLSGRVYFGE